VNLAQQHYNTWHKHDTQDSLAKKCWLHLILQLEPEFTTISKKTKHKISEARSLDELFMCIMKDNPHISKEELDFEKVKNAMS
jgi:hypothetical protein